MKKRSTPAQPSRLHRLPEGPVEWRLDLSTRDRAMAGIALAREALRAARQSTLEEDGEQQHATAA